tara:strand:- start:492 stop:770 length:279 start_codon:yes stop_codon:yes gene_type:complete
MNQPLTQSVVEDMASNAEPLPGCIIVAAAAHADVVGDDLDKVVVMTLVFQMAGGGSFLRQSFVIDASLAGSLADAILNPIILDPNDESDIQL